MAILLSYLLKFKISCNCYKCSFCFNVTVTITNEYHSSICYRGGGGGGGVQHVSRVLVKELLHQITFHVSPIGPVHYTDGEDHQGLSDIQVLFYLYFTVM